MQQLTAACLILSLCAPVLAQSTITSPPGYLTTAGSNVSVYLGRYADGRYQVADGELRGKALTMSQIDFRLDNRSHTTATASGRSWSRVTLDMSDTDVAAMSVTYDDNTLSTPTRVFDNKMTWPTVTGRPGSTPWGHVAFPFTRAWVYTGKHDMLTDFRFAGGTLANSRAWTGSSAVAYYFDGIPNQDARSGGGAYMPPAANNCNDSALTATTGAYAYGIAHVFHLYHTTYTYRDKLRLYWYSYYTAPGKPVVHAFGLGSGNTAGFNMGARCHRLYLDTSQPFLLIPRTADETTTAYSGATQILIPWEKTWQGITFHLQGAWADSSTSAFSLTRARSFSVPAYPTAILKKRFLFHYLPARTTGVGPYSTYTALPLPRITYK